MPVFDILKRFVGTAAASSERRGDDRLRAPLGARVLVVDDSATIRAVLGKMLAQDGYEVLKAPDGENAVEMAQSQFPDLIFLDIVLPGMSGFAVLRALRRDTRTRTTPIIMMSGNQQATEQFYVQRFGADGFIKKPFGRAEVFHSIRSLVQAGRMSARVAGIAEDEIPEGMTPEEWDSIPDVAMPDEAHAAGQPVMLDGEPLESPAAIEDTPEVAAEPVAEAAPIAAAPGVPNADVPAAPVAPVAENIAAPEPPVPVTAAATPEDASAEEPAGADVPVEVEPPAPAPVEVAEEVKPATATVAPVQAAIPFQVVAPADAHPAERPGHSGFWSLRALSQKMHPGWTSGSAGKGGVKFDVKAAPGTAAEKPDEAAGE
jgi:twitching motility two-component system response regulator PilH